MSATMIRRRRRRLRHALLPARVLHRPRSRVVHLPSQLPFLSSFAYRTMRALRRTYRGPRIASDDTVSS